MQESIRIDKITNALVEIGIPANLRGFTYIIKAEQLIAENQEYMIGITKALYIDIAKAFGTTPCSVERCIRTAISDGWKATPVDVKLKIFGNSMNTGKVHPTNAHFIVMLYYYISLQ